jgi:hypothetical protein
MIGPYPIIFLSHMAIGKKSILVILIILTLDQLSKILIKTNMSIGQEIHVFGNWFILHFTENNGMAFGMDLPGENGKIFPYPGCSRDWLLFALPDQTKGTQWTHPVCRPDPGRCCREYF